MIKKILLLTGVILLVTGCGNLELKKSASNKLFDTKGFDGSKRKPLYNGKYIDRAKRNVVEGNYDEDIPDIDEPDEFVDPYTQNRIMYSNMVKNERSNRGKNKKSRTEPYPNIGHARDIAMSENKNDSNVELKQELAEIRSMLVSAKKDLAKYKCPLQDTAKAPIHNAPPPKKPVTPKPAPVKQEEIDDDIDDSIEHEEDVVVDSPKTQNDVPIHNPPVTQKAPEQVVANVPAQQTAAPITQPVIPAPAQTHIPTPTQKPHLAKPTERNMINLAPTTK